jgi:hypothetical protein
MGELGRMIFRRFANIINKEGGITLNQKFEVVSKTTGYFVSLFGIKRVLPNRNEEYNVSVVSGHDVEVCFRELASKYGLLCTLGYVGFWKDTVKCDLYADITIHITSKFLAVLVGKIFKQIAIFDCKSNECIILK